MKPWEKSNYYPKKESVTISVEIELPPKQEEQKEEIAESQEGLKEEQKEKEYVCPVCGKKFTKKVSLINHLRAHKRKGEIDDIVVE